MEAALAFFRALRQGGKRRVAAVESKGEIRAEKKFPAKISRHDFGCFR
jgi:hypothetical protein